MRILRNANLNVQTLSPAPLRNANVRTSNCPQSHQSRMQLGCVSALDSVVGEQSGSQPHIAATVARGDLEVAGLRVAVVELNDDSQATRFPL